MKTTRSVEDGIPTQSMGTSEDQGKIVITKSYDLILLSCNHTNKFLRNHRFVLRERIDRNLCGLLESLITTEYTKNRQRLLEEANRERV
jgi:hypothetical protein